MTYDVIIRNGRWFDGTGAPSAIRNLGIRDGHVVAVTPDDLDDTDCPTVIDASGKWVLPGMLDIHTHYDVEVLNGPSLSESLRHGVTTVMLGSCSLSTVYVDGEDAGDIFGRVEAIPRDHVIAAVDNHKTWTNGEGTFRPSGSPARAQRRSLHRTLRYARRHGPRPRHSKRERPSRVEQAQMERMLSEALAAGFVGMSSQQLLFDKLDGDVCRSRTLPSTYAKPRELRRLKSMLRRAGRVLQSGPDIQNPFNLGSQLVQSLGLFRNPLKTSLLSAADVKANPFAVLGMVRPPRLINRLGGNFRWQHLPVPFEVYADGIDLVIFEEFGAGAAALHLRDEVERNALRDESYRRRFRKQYESKFGVRVWHRDFFDAEIVDCPDPSVIGKSFGAVGLERGGLHPVDAFLDLVLEHGRELRWRTTISNHRPDVLKKLARDPGIQMGFSDAGAHLRNMAFYNMGLRLLRHVRDAERGGKPFMTIEHAPCTGSPANWRTGTASTQAPGIGDRADIVVVDPERLDSTLDDYAEDTVEHYGGLSRMVNRNEDTVAAVFVSGRAVFLDGKPTDIVGTERTAASCAPRTERPRMHPSNRS